MIKSLDKKKDESWEEFKGREDKMWRRGAKKREKGMKRGGREKRKKDWNKGIAEGKVLRGGKEGCTEIIRDNGGWGQNTEWEKKRGKDKVDEKIYEIHRWKTNFFNGGF